MGQALARRIGFDRASALGARRIGSARAPPAPAHELGTVPGSGAERGCGPGQPGAGRAALAAQPAAAGLRKRCGGQARRSGAAEPCTREAGGRWEGSELSSLEGAVTLADAARLPPCVLMSSYTDVTVPWCPPGPLIGVLQVCISAACVSVCGLKRYKCTRSNGRW